MGGVAMCMAALTPGSAMPRSITDRASLRSLPRGGRTNVQRAADSGAIAFDTIRLPMHGIADSLNVSATAAVLAYEALRQLSP